MFSELARTVTSSREWSAMTFGAVPPRKAPTVITAGSRGETSRVTIVCNASTIWAPMTTGSLPRCGAAPWVATPRTVMRTVSALE